MKIQFKPANFFKLQNNNNNKQYNSNSLKYRYNLSCDTVSFKGKSITQQVKELPIDAFLSDGLREYILSNIDEKDIVTLHKEYYAPLLDCKTLDEAKEIYPEFQDVIDIKDLDLKKINSKILKQIARGDFEGLTKENASLEFLKKYVGQLIPVIPYSKDYFNLSHTTARKLIGIFNISMDKRYRDVILSEKQSQNFKKHYQDPQYRAKMSERMRNLYQDPQYRAEISERMKKQWQDPQYHAKVSENIKKQWQDPQLRAKMSENMKKAYRGPQYRAAASKRMKEKWQDPQYHASQAEKIRKGSQGNLVSPETIKGSREYWQDPQHRAKVSERMKKQWQDPQYRAKVSESQLRKLNSEEHEIEAKIISIAKKLALAQYPFDVKLFEETEKEFPRIREILSRPEKALTDEEITYLKNFRAAKSKNREKIRKELNKIKKQILTRWSFYEKDRNLNVVLALALNSDPDNKKD